MKNFRWILAVIAGSMLLPACSDRIYTANKNINVDPDSDTGIVIIGMRLSSDQLGPAAMTWRKLDPETAYFTTTFGPGLKIARFDHNYDPKTGVALDRTRYFVREIDAGTYALDFSGISTSPTYYRINYRPNTTSFEIKKGEILYVGNFLFDIPIYANYTIDARNATLEIEGHTVSEMKEFLAREYKNLQGPIRVRKPVPFVLKGS